MAARQPTYARRRPLPLIAAAFSALVPGLGQWYVGDRRKAWIHLAITAVFVLPAMALLVLVFFVDGIDLALVVSRPFFRSPGLLLVLLGANILLLGFRAGSAVDAYIAATPRPVSTGGFPVGFMFSVTALVLLLAAVAVPHYWVGRRNVALYDLLSHDFSSDPGQVTTTSVIDTTAAPTTTVPGTTAATTTTLTTTTTAPTTTITTPPPFHDHERVTVLLLGSDAGVGRVGIRADSMIVLSIDPQTGDTAMFSIPRNMIKLPIPPDHAAFPMWEDGAWGDPSNLAWGVYAYGLQHPELFQGPNTGGDAAKTILGNLLGIDIDYFALVHMQGFVDMIDALGGVDITVTSHIIDHGYMRSDGTVIDLDFPVGTYHMDGQTALAFSRSRTQSNDYVRMGRQRCLLEALAREADPVSLLRQLPSLVPAIEASVVTDVPMAMIPDFLDLVRTVDTSSIVSIRFMPNAPDLAGTDQSYIAYRINGYGVPNVDLIRQRVQAVLDGSAEQLGLPPLVDECGVATSG